MSEYEKLKEELKDQADMIDTLRADDPEDDDACPPLSHLLLRALARIRQLEQAVVDVARAT